MFTNVIYNWLQTMLQKVGVSKQRVIGGKQERRSCVWGRGIYTLEQGIRVLLTYRDKRSCATNSVWIHKSGLNFWMNSHFVNRSR